MRQSHGLTSQSRKCCAQDQEMFLLFRERCRSERRKFQQFWWCSSGKFRSCTRARKLGGRGWRTAPQTTWGVRCPLRSNEELEASPLRIGCKVSGKSFQNRQVCLCSALINSSIRIAQLMYKLQNKIALIAPAHECIIFGASQTKKCLLSFCGRRKREQRKFQRFWGRSPGKFLSCTPAGKLGGARPPQTTWGVRYPPDNTRGSWRTRSDTSRRQNPHPLPPHPGRSICNTAFGDGVSAYPPYSARLKCWKKRCKWDPFLP